MSGKTTPNTNETGTIPVITPRALAIKLDANPVKLTDLMQSMGLNGPRIPAENLKDQTFIIVGAKQFASAFPGQDHAYFVVAHDKATGEVFTTVLGGAACVDILDALVNANFDNPLEVTLRWVQGGKFNGYYTLE